jgi:uncharacterized membrane protein
MSWLPLVLRLLHIGGGVFWAGATFVFAGFIEPTAGAAGQDGARFLQRLAGGRYPVAMMVAGVTTVLAGIALLGIDSGGFQPAFMGSRLGVTLSIGGACGIVAAVVGIGLAARNAFRLKGVAAAIQAQKGGPTTQQLGQIAAIQERLRLGGRLTAMLLGIAVICMAIARYV